MNLPVYASKAMPKQVSVPRYRTLIRGSKQLTAYLFLMPALILFAVFAWYPILTAVQMSFHDINLTGVSTWVGLDNYTLMFKDPAFRAAWENSFLFASW